MIHALSADFRCQPDRTRVRPLAGVDLQPEPEIACGN